MAKTSRDRKKSLTKFLEKDFASFSYFQLWRLLGRVHNSDNICNEFNISAPLSYSYPSSDVSKLNLITSNVEVSHFNLYGYNSPLPIFYTNYLIDNLQNKNEIIVREFVDLLHKYLHSIYIDSLNRYKPLFSTVEKKSNDFKNLIYSFVGWRESSIQPSTIVAEDQLFRYASLLSRRQRSVIGLTVLIKGLMPSLSFDLVPCRPHLINIPNKYRVQLGRSKIGVQCILGSKYYKKSGILYLYLKNLLISDWEGILNKKDKWMRFLNSVRYYLGCYEVCKVLILLKDGQADSMELGKNVSIGKNSWLIDGSLSSQNLLPVSFMLP